MRHSAAGLAAAAVLSLGISQAALAADMPVKASVYKAAPAIAYYRWTGCYLGIAGGWAGGKSQQYAETGGVTLPVTNKFDINGGLIGATLGCNYQVADRWVVGVEGDWSWTNKDGGAFDIAPFNTAFFSATEEKWIATIRGRIGFVAGATGNLLVYLTGGAAAAKVQINVDGPRPNSTVFGSESQTYWGWIIGAGLEWGFAPHWTAKAEYLYADLGKESFFCPTPPPNLVTRCGGVDVTNHILRAGINFRF